MYKFAQTPLLTSEREQELSRRLTRENDQSAREEMILSNLRLVVVIAKRFSGRGLALDDLVAEGNIGLMRAVEKFDPELNVRFSTYAAWWIKRTMRRALTNHSSAVRVPNYMHELITGWKKASATLEDQLQRSPTLIELSSHMAISPKQARSIKNAFLASRCPWQTATDNSRGLTLEAMLPNEKIATPDRIVLEQDEVRLICAWLDQIVPRKAQVLRLRFGLENGQAMTHKAIGQRLGITRERIRQIEKEGLQDLLVLSRRQNQERPCWVMSVDERESRVA